jgi:hypothetical protein
MAKTYLECVGQTRIVSGGGPVTRERWDGTAGATGVWNAGQLLKLSSGALVEALDNASTADFDTDEIPDGTILFLALETVETGAATKMKVQRILPTTILEGPLMSGESLSAPATAVTAIIGTEYAMKQFAAVAASGYKPATPAGWFAVNKMDSPTKAMATIVDVENNFNPVPDPNTNLDVLGERYPLVRFKMTGLSDI